MPPMVPAAAAGSKGSGKVKDPLEYGAGGGVDPLQYAGDYDGPPYKQRCFKKITTGSLLGAMRKITNTASGRSTPSGDH